MAEITESQIREKLAGIRYPGFSRDIISFGLVKGIRIAGADVVVQLAVTTNDARIPQQLQSECEQALATIPGIGEARVRIDIHAPAQAARSNTVPLPARPSFRVLCSRFAITRCWRLCSP